MKKWWVLPLLLLSSIVLGYQNKEFNWTPPTQYEDGSPLPDGEIASYNIYCNGSLLGNVVNAGGTNTWTSPDGSLPPGTYDCYATTVASNGLESEASNTVNFTVSPSNPAAPSDFSVTLP